MLCCDRLLTVEEVPIRGKQQIVEMSIPNLE